MMSGLVRICKSYKLKKNTKTILYSYTESVWLSLGCLTGFTFWNSYQKLKEILYNYF